LFGVPNLEGVSTIGGPCVDAGAWCFLNSEGDFSVSVTTDTFTYSISPVSADEPPMMLLLSIGLGVLLLRSRRRDTRSGLPVSA
jgi:MYXO-CTERM domain-containing protein